MDIQNQCNIVHQLHSNKKNFLKARIFYKERKNSKIISQCLVFGHETEWCHFKALQGLICHLVQLPFT